MRAGGEFGPGMGTDDMAVVHHDGAPLVSRDGRIVLHAVRALELFQHVLEMVMRNAHHDRAVHLDETAIAVPCETRITGGAGKPFHRFVIQAQVQHGIHHTRHGHARAGTDRDQQRRIRIAKAQAHRLLDALQGGGDLRLQLGRVLPAVFIKGRTDFRCNGKARRYGQAVCSHLRQVGTLAAQKVAHIRASLVQAISKAVYPFGHVCSFLRASVCQK